MYVRYDNKLTQRRSFLGALVNLFFLYWHMGSMAYILWQYIHINQYLTHINGNARSFVHFDRVFLAWQVAEIKSSINKPFIWSFCPKVEFKLKYIP